MVSEHWKTQPRDERGRWTDEHGFFRTNTSYAQILSVNRGAISGALDSESREAEEHAKRYYEFVRKRKDDVEKIAKNTGFSIQQIQEIKNYLFINVHDFEMGKGRFYPDYDISQSWQRLIAGNFEVADIVLLEHEQMEIKFVEEGYSQTEAHNLTDKVHNYKNAITELKERRKKSGRN